MDGRENPTNSGTPENSTQGGIFSSPDLTVNTENVPTLGGERENPQEVSGGNAERIAAAFSGTEVTQQKAATAAAMGNQPLVTPIPSTATGDIQLPGEKRKRSKLPFIIALVVVVVAVAVGGILIAPGLIRNNKISGTKSSFNTFANFLLYGTDSDAKIEGNYMYGDQYYLADKTAEQASEHLRVAGGKYQEFLNVYEQKLASSFDEETDSLIKNYASQLDLYRYLLLYPGIDMETVTIAYLRQPDAVMSAINEYYAPFFNSSFQETKDFATNYLKAAEDLLAGLGIFQEFGCIENNRVVSECLTSTDDLQLARATEFYDKFLNFTRQQIATISNLSIKVFQNVWYITETMNEK